MKDIVIEEEINPEVEKPGRRKKLDAASGGQEKEAPDVDWDAESVPLLPTGGKPRFIDPVDKHNINEGETVFVTFRVEGDPVPDIEWFKSPEKDMSCNPRAKLFTNGDAGTITMGLRNCKAEDEGEFNCVLTSSKGKAQFDFKLFVTVEGGMDFRAMLMKKKVKQKKVVVQKVEWIEPLFDIEAQENKDKQIIMTAKLSVKNLRGKWYQRNETIMMDIKSGENGRELQKGDKYDWKQEEDMYTLIINDPKLEDDGSYILLVKEVDAKTSGYLTVKKRDPEYWFVKPLNEIEKAYTSRPFSMAVEISEPGVKLKWLKNGAPIDWSQSSCIKKDEGCMSCIYFPDVVMDDSSYYSAQIMEFMKNGYDDQTNCWFEVEEYPHTFTSKLKQKNVVENDDVEFDITTEADDAEVTWYIGNKKIVPDGTRIVVTAEGKKRKLIINGCQLKDCGEITCKTNKDKSTAKLHVGMLNEITKEVTSDAYRSIAGMVFAVEREDLMLYVEVKDFGAPVTFYINGEEVDKNSSRFQQSTTAPGKHQLLVKHVELVDAGILEVRTPLNKGDKLLTTAITLDVMMGERKPEMKKVGQNNLVEGVAGKECSFNVDFQVEGKKQSELDFKIMVDGKELKNGQDVNIVMQDGKMSVNILNPKHEKSGNYKVVMSNAQGSCEQDININIMDKPKEPSNCTVSDVFHDSCVVNWKAPEDDGGTEILHYIVEELDVTGGGGWSQVAEVGPTDKKAKIKDLNTGNKYRFRVKAVNKLGQSLPCEMTGGDIMVKDPWNAPGQPGKPKILDWGPDHGDMAWAPPESDGGAKITHYVIEKKENNMKEFVVGKILTIKEVKNKDGLIYGTCDGLIEGYEYMFRVKAVNLGSTGLWNYSVPSLPSDTMIAKTRYMSSKIKDPGMYDIELKAGKTIRYDIWFTGEPEPLVTWERNDCVLTEEEDRTSLELFTKNGIYTEKNSVLTIVKANRKVDSGVYKIRLCCGGGSTEATGRVNVLDVPDKPKTFQVNEVRAEHCKLSWEAPDDDGGSPITNYLIQLMDLEVNEWVNCAETASKSVEIKGLKPGHLYRFEVVAVNKEGESAPARTKDPCRAENPYMAPGEPTDLRIVDFDDKSVTLRWAKPQNDGGRPISHYIIQKKDEFGGWYDALATDNDNCFATIEELEARIPGLSLGKRYQFRVVAVSKAGESEPSQDTKPHLCRYKNLSPAIDKGSGGSKTVKVNRLTCFQIKVKGEPMPTFTWKKDGQKVEQTEALTISVVHNPDEQTAVATLQILRTAMPDAGCYTLVAENRNGVDSVDLDLVVLDEMHTNDCDMFSTGSLECTCNNRFRAEIADQETLKLGIQDSSEFSPKLIPVPQELALCGVVGGKNVGLRSSCDLQLTTDRVGRNLSLLFVKNTKTH